MDGFNDLETTELTNLQKAKYISFIHAFEKYGLSPTKSFEENEYRLFLNNKSSSFLFSSV